MGKGSGSSSSTTEAPQWLQSNLQGLYSQAQSVTGQPLNQYSNPLVAGFTPSQNAAMNTVDQVQGVSAPYTNAASQYAAQGAAPVFQNVQQYSPSSISQYQSPYTQQVVNATQAQLDQNDAVQQQQLMSGAIQSGASPFGGDRAGVAAAALAGQQDLANNQTISGLYNTGFNNAQSELNNQQQLQLSGLNADSNRAANAAATYSGLGTTAQNNALSGASAQLQTGALQQQLEQEQLNIPYEQYQQSQAYPYQNLSALESAAGLTGSLAGGTTTSTPASPSIGGTLAGLGTAGLALAGVKKGGRIGHYDSGGATNQYLATGIPDVSTSFITRSSSNAPTGHLTAPSNGTTTNSSNSPTSLSGLNSDIKMGKGIGSAWNGSSMSASDASAYNTENGLSEGDADFASKGDTIGGAKDWINNLFGGSGGAGSLLSPGTILPNVSQGLAIDSSLPWSGSVAADAVAPAGIAAADAAATGATLGAADMGIGAAAVDSGVGAGIMDILPFLFAKKGGNVGHYDDGGAATEDNSPALFNAPIKSANGIDIPQLNTAALNGSNKAAVNYANPLQQLSGATTQAPSSSNFSSLDASTANSPFFSTPSVTTVNGNAVAQALQPSVSDLTNPFYNGSAKQQFLSSISGNINSTGGYDLTPSQYQTLLSYGYTQPTSKNGGKVNGFAKGGLTHYDDGGDVPTMSLAQLNAESGNQDYNDDGTPVTSSKGALYSHQVMPSTAEDPGFGIAPAKDNSPEEYNRVGEDYNRMLLNRYSGDKQLAAIAYNAGPSVADRIYNKDSDINDIPAETKGYLAKIGLGQYSDIGNLLSNPDIDAQKDDDSIVDHSGPTVKVSHPGSSESLDLGIPSQSSAPTFLGNKINMPLLAAGLGMLGSKSPFAGEAIGQGGLEGIKEYADEQNKARELAQQQETSRHNVSEEDLKQQQLQQGKFTVTPYGDVVDTRTGIIKPGPMNATQQPAKTDANGQPLTGNDYLSTLPPQRAIMAKKMATGDVPWPTGFALKNPMMMQAMVDAEQYDPTANGQRYGNVQKFQTGKQGDQIKYLNTSIAHLDTAQDLANNLGNTGTPIFNKVANIWKTQTGKEAPTDFNTGKQIITNEVMKAISNSGAGGVAERENLQNQFTTAGSPEQLAGAITTAQKLLVGQASSVKNQYEDATGRKDFLDKKLTPRTKAIYQKFDPDQIMQSSASFQPRQVRNGTKVATVSTPQELAEANQQGFK